MSRGPGRRASETDIIVASVVGGALLFDGCEWNPAARGLRDTVIYCDDSVQFAEHIRPLMRDGDYAVGSPKGVFGVTMRTHTGTVQIIASDAWGQDRSGPDVYRAALLETRRVCADAGIDWRNTAGATVAHLLRDCGIGPCLDGRWRGLAISALHAGPIVHLSGGYYDGVHIDRRSAYAHAMSSKLPTGGMFLCARAGIEREGITVARVTVPPGLTVPPLPVNTQTGRVVYPVGAFRGAWHNDALRQARDIGVKIEPLYTASWTQHGDMLERLVHRLEALPKAVKKPLYTRAWGKMASSGGWRGDIVQPDGKDSLQAGGLWWSHSMPTPADKTHPTYRPDIAGAIVSRNHTAMIRAANSLAVGSVAAMHVDALWTSDIGGAERLLSPSVGGFKLEHRGGHRQYACGVYQGFLEGGERVIGCAGWRGRVDGLGRVPTHEQFVAFAESGKLIPDGRHWDVSPRAYQTATSEPIEVRDGETYTIIGGPSPWVEGFWRGGYYHVSEVKGGSEGLDV